MKKSKTFYITTPLYYVNAAPHIGHAYTQIACDAMARFLKQSGEKVFFMTGTDEHGEKIEKASLENGFKKDEEKKFVDSIIPRFKELWKKLDIDYDFFIRTTDKAHEDTVKNVLSALYKQGDIYKKIYSGWFCTPCEMFWSDIQAPKGVCPDCNRPLEKLDEENYFFKMSKYQGELLRCIEENKMLIKPEIRKNEILSFLKGNELQDLCISRSKNRLKWGIALPFDKDYVAYVWVDALINYISGIGYSNDKKKFKQLWPSDMHVIGKDILRHHAVYWPIMLFAVGEKPPKSIFAHGWWVMGGEKMSKSKGNVADPEDMIGKYGADALRYYLLSAVQFGYDGNFSEELFIKKYNNDLANDLGNLLSRSLTMVDKYFGGKVPQHKGDSEIRKYAETLPGTIEQCMHPEKEGPNFQAALNSIWQLVNMANKYIEVASPWKYAKENNTEKLKEIMSTLMQVLGLAAVFLYPFMPETSRKIEMQLGQKEKISYKNMKWGLVKPGTKINKGNPLFPRINTKY